ncbi:SDR family NAD(P)-dependent oxidoreductase [Streptomyces uncialis]|uniref:SDR family NAD(P)-dependent oxidoreductase n=1 Tax=Streptomyces uncialis TaxID=1048205 RepID=UPI003815C927
MKKSKWNTQDNSDQNGRTAVITGANTGIGFETAAALAERGAHVVLAVRNQGKGHEAAEKIAARSPKAALSVQRLDLGSLDSVRAAAEELRARHDRIDLLVNNAGVMWTPRSTTADGFELQFGTNHLGHFALTGLLLDRVLATRGSRVVTVSSDAHRLGASVNFDDPQSEQKYSRTGAYGQSKLANLLFAYELQRRLAGKSATISLAAHPGGAATELARNSNPFVRVLFDRLIVPLIAQDAASGALPSLRAATDPQATGGEYYGPDGLTGLRGHPTAGRSSKKSHNAADQLRLWTVSQHLTGVVYPV